MKGMIDTTDIKLNFYALAVAIFKECSTETAFEKIQSPSPDRVKPQLSIEDIQDMRKFREEGVIYKEIASYYGATFYAIYDKLHPREIKK